MRTRIVLAVAASALLAGCVRFQQGLGFDDVSLEVEERSGHELRWHRLDAAKRDSAPELAGLVSGELTPDKAVKLALLNNTSLQAEYEKLGIAQADLVQAGLLSNPVVDGEVRVGGLGVGLDFAIVQRVVDVLFLPLRQRMGEAGFEVAKLSVIRSVLKLAGDTRKDFYALQAALQRREMQRSVVRATDASYELAQRLRRAGNINDLDLANERVLFEQSKLDLSSVELSVMEHRERLNRRMGLWGSAASSWKTTERLPQVSQNELHWEQLEHTAIQRSLTLAETRLLMEIAAVELGIAKPSTLWGAADAGVAANREPDGGWTFGTAFSLPVPLFNRGEAAIERAGAVLRQLEERYKQTAIEIRSEARVAFARMVTRQNRALYRQKVLLPLRSEIVSETQKQFNGMLVGAFQLLQAKKEEIDSGARYIQELLAYWEARTDLDQVMSGRRIEMSDEEEVLSESEKGGRSE